ncbi:MAG: alpha/beta hydrolase [Actinomycetota bacterium]|nr:alpha/beta hydrolase [Actinomycetota bacterium]
MSDRQGEVATVAGVRVERVRVAEGVALHVHRWDGDGSPFLLVHGLASNLHLWDGVAAGLAGRGHAVVAVDLRGHGESDKPDDGYDMTAVTDDLIELVAALGVDRPVAVGQSWGANLVLELGWRSPELVRGVACVDGGWIELQRSFPTWDECARAMAPPSTAARSAGDLEAELRAHHPDWPEPGIAGALACYERRPDGTVRPWLELHHHLAILRSLWEHQPSARYREVKVPVLLVPAEPDPEADASWARDRHRQVEEAATELPKVRVRWMKGDHDLHAQHPEQVAELLHGAVIDGFFAP